MLKEMKYIKIILNTTSVLIYIGLIVIVIFIYFIFYLSYPTEYRRTLLVYSYDNITDTKIISTPDLIIYNDEGFKLIHKFDNYIQDIFFNDTLIVVKEIKPYSEGIIHKFNTKTNEHFNFSYENKCTDFPIEYENYYFTRIENNEIITYWGCNENGYRMNLSNNKIYYGNLKRFKIDLYKKNFYFSKELIKGYGNIPLKKINSINIDTNIFKVIKKYQFFYHIKNKKGDDFLTDGKEIFKISCKSVQFAVD